MKVFYKKKPSKTLNNSFPYYLFPLFSNSWRWEHFWSGDSQILLCEALKNKKSKRFSQVL